MHNDKHKAHSILSLTVQLGKSILLLRTYCTKCFKAPKPLYGDGGRRAKASTSIIVFYGLSEMLEVRINELAEEFGVHRNTIRNWIKAGILPAQKGPGRRYLLKWADYVALCERFGKRPRRLPETAKEEESKKSPYRLLPPSTPLYPDPSWADICLTCGACASACPISGVDGLDPRKVVRMAALGMDEELINSDWAWKCSLCAKCEESCPMKVEIVQLICRIRSLRPRDKIPGPLVRGITTCLEKGNNLGIPKEDFLALLKYLARELAEECPGFEVPIDVHGARLLVTINSKEPFAEPESLKYWWKIFYAVKESWTISSEYWEGVNWGFFSGNEEAMRAIVGRLVDNLHRLNCEALLLPESGHAYLATRLVLEQWFPEALNKFKIYSVFDLLMEYLNKGLLVLDAKRHPGLTTYHDSCNYGRRSLKILGRGYFEEGRIITQLCCPDFVDMQPNRNGNYCCGAGGGAWSSPYKAERIFHGRIKARQIKETQAKRVIVTCHQCRDQIKFFLNKEYELGVEVKYLWELVADSLVFDPS